MRSCSAAASQVCVVYRPFEYDWFGGMYESPEPFWRLSGAYVFR